MSFYGGMTCEDVTIKGDKGTPITAYVARPAGSGRFPGVVLVHHLPGWSELYMETTRRLAHHGYLAICANLYEREGGGSGGNPDDVYHDWVIANERMSAALAAKGYHYQFVFAKNAGFAYQVARTGTMWAAVSPWIVTTTSTSSATLTHSFSRRPIRSRGK